MWQGIRSINEYPRDPALPWIQGCTEWMENGVRDGGKLYYVNIMFEPMRVPRAELMPLMRKAIDKFYGRFCTKFVRNGRSKTHQHELPRLWLFPDLPYFKPDKEFVGENTINGDGLHFNGSLLIPTHSRFSECPIKYLERKQELYARHGIERIHIKEGYYAPGLARYAAKTIKNRNADEADIIIFPRAVRELPAKKPVAFDPQERLLKDIQSRCNVSDEIAREMLTKMVKAA